MTVVTGPALAPPRRHPRLVWLWAALTVAGIVAGLVALRRSPSEPPPPVLAALPDFSLQERAGRTVGRSDLSGRPWVADFIFTRCAGSCPAMTAQMARLQREIPPEVVLVSITVDPEHDTRDVLSRYAESVHAGHGWLFLTGDRAAIYRLATEGFKLAAMEIPPEERKASDEGPFLHSSKLVLVDGQARIRGYYDSTEDSALERLRADLSRVRDERS